MLEKDQNHLASWFFCLAVSEVRLTEGESKLFWSFPPAHFTRFWGGGTTIVFHPDRHFTHFYPIANNIPNAHDRGTKLFGKIGAGNIFLSKDDHIF